MSERQTPENDAAREDLCRHGVPMFYPCAWCVIPPAMTAEVQP